MPITDSEILQLIDRGELAFANVRIAARQMKALETIAATLEKLAKPPTMTRLPPPEAIVSGSVTCTPAPELRLTDAPLDGQSQQRIEVGETLTGDLGSSSGQRIEVVTAVTEPHKRRRRGET